MYTISNEFYLTPIVARRGGDSLEDPLSDRTWISFSWIRSDRSVLTRLANNAVCLGFGGVLFVVASH